MLNREQLQRYHRHLLLPQIGEEGQEKLLAARVLIVGLGGLGCPAALYLAAAGVGRLGLVDFDRVDVSNLQRQVLYTTEDVGRAKVDVAARRLHVLNPDVRVEVFNERLNADSAERILGGYDYVLDGSDNFATRYLVNDACVLLGKVNVFGSVFRFEGQVSVFAHPDGPCYRCLFPEPPQPGAVPDCAEAGVLGVLPGQIGTAQATETIKLILGRGETLIGRLLLFDSLSMTWREMRLARDRACPVCGDHPSITRVSELDGWCGVSIAGEGIEEMEPADIRRLLESDAASTLLLDVREPIEAMLSPGPAGSIQIPLRELIDRLGELEAYREQTVVAYCAVGIRSLKALQILRGAGFNRLINLTGGLERLRAEG